MRYGVRPNGFAHPGVGGCTESGQAAHSVHNRRRGVNGSVIGWVVLAVGAWCVVALAVGVIVGRAIRLRDRQVPWQVGPRIPVPRSAPDSVPHPVPARDRRGDPGG